MFMSRVESLRRMWDGLEPDPNMRLEDADNGSYEVFFSRGDTSKVKGKFWARVLDGVDPTKKGGYALKGERWLHSGDRVRDGDIVAYNTVGSGRHGNFMDMYVSGVLNGEARVLSWCNWSDRDEKQGFIEDLAVIFRRLDGEAVDDEAGDGDGTSGEMVDDSSHGRPSRSGGVLAERGIREYVEYRTVGEYSGGYIRVRSDVMETLGLGDGDLCIVTIGLPGIRRR